MKKYKKSYFLMFLILVLSFSLGYAYLNSSLYINGTSIISANVWEVELDNLNVTAGSVAAIKEPTLDNATTTSFEVKLDNKEDFYEFTVDVVNRGEHDAKLGSLVETTGFTTEQEQYFDYTVTYQNNEPIQVNQLVKKDEFVRLKSKVEYKEEVNITSVPESAKTLKLGFKMNYDLDDGKGIIVDNNGKEKIKPIANGSLDAIGTIVTIGSEKFYIMGYDGDNVKLLSMYNLYVGGEYNKNTGVWKAYSDEATGIQDSTMLGWVSSGELYKGTTAFSNIGPNYEGSIAEGYVNNYKFYLEELGVNIISARLIYDEEVYSCNKSWIYSTTYWTGSISEWMGNHIVIVTSDQEVFEEEYYNFGGNGIRPVVIIPKSEIFVSETKLIEFTIDGVAYQALEGMTWEEWISSEYNKDNYVISGNYIMKSSGTTYSLQYYATGEFGVIVTYEVLKNSIIVSDEYFFSDMPSDY